MSNRVLFVDDEPNVLDGIRRQLRNRLDVETATGAAAGLARAQKKLSAGPTSGKLTCTRRSQARAGSSTP